MTVGEQTENSRIMTVDGVLCCGLAVCPINHQRCSCRRNLWIACW